MNWDAIGAGAELLGAIGVILTLIYLARQIRHNSQQLKGSSTVAVHDFQNRLTDQLLAQPELFQLILRANFEWETITDDEKSLYGIWNLKEASFIELCFHLREQGALDESIYQSRLAYFLNLYSLPGRRAWWEEQANSSMIDHEFYDEVSRKLQDGKGSAEEFLDQFPQYRKQA
jgi:hypothetical protein